MKKKIYTIYPNFAFEVSAKDKDEAEKLATAELEKITHNFDFEVEEDEDNEGEEVSDKITHDHECGCGKPATLNLQQNYQLYEITPDGDFNEIKSWEGDTNEFYCDECYENV